MFIKLSPIAKNCKKQATRQYWITNTILCTSHLQGYHVYVIDNHFMSTILQDYTVELWISVSNKTTIQTQGDFKIFTGTRNECL